MVPERPHGRMPEQVRETVGRGQPRIADRLEAFASLLELADANPYTARAYRRAAETIRGAPLPVAELVRRGRVRELRGIGPGIEARLRELIETGEIAELAELERELAPDLVGLGRYLGLERQALRSSSRGRWACGPPRSCARPRPPAGCATCPGSAPRPRRGCSRRSPARRAPAAARAAARPRAGARRRRSPPRSAARPRATCAAGATPCERLAVVCAAPEPAAGCSRASPSCRRSSRWSSGASAARSASPSRASRSSCVVAAPGRGSGPS